MHQQICIQLLSWIVKYVEHVDKTRHEELHVAWVPPSSGCIKPNTQGNIEGVDREYRWGGVSCDEGVKN